MAIQATVFSPPLGATADIDTVSTGLTLSSGTLTGDLSTGVAGGQTVKGGTASAEALTYSSTTHATKGNHIFGTTAKMFFDEENARLHVNGTGGSNKVNVNSGSVEFTTAESFAGSNSGITGSASTLLLVAAGAGLVRLSSADGLSQLSGFRQGSVTATITASTTQTQGQGALVSEYNEVSVCANVNDTVTMPAALAGRRVMIMNNGAQTLQIFPASGDAFSGSAVDASTTLAAAANKSWVSFNGTTWETD